MNVKPLGSRVLLKVLTAEDKSAGGIYIPANAQEKTQEGIVKAVGESSEVTVKVEDKVIYDKYAGTQLKLLSEEYLILKMDDIIAVVQ